MRFKDGAWSRVVGAYLAFVFAAAARPPAETVIHSFRYFPQGAAPYATLIRDQSGNLYGTTNQGGVYAAGAVFVLAPSGAYTVLYSFTGGSDGAHPYAGLIRDSAGNLYGTTFQGGSAGAGVVYKLSPAGQETVLYTFSGGVDGANPYAGVISDPAGNLYGTATAGGKSNAGVVYKVDPSGTETVLYSFTGGADGANPYAGLIADPSGNLYGTTRGGGQASSGVLYKLNMSTGQTVLHSFGPPSGETPMAGVIRDPEGNLFGTATTVIYKFSANGHYSVLHDLPVGLTGGPASAGVIRDNQGNLYGTTDPVVGPIPSYSPFGSVYKLNTVGFLTALYSFPGAPQSGGAATGPNGGLVFDPFGNLYGATPYGGIGGMLYQVDAAGHPQSLYSLPAAQNGTTPRAPVTVGPAGEIYGTTTAGGAANAGIVYKIQADGRQTVLYTFSGGDDGAYPQAGVALDSSGNIYGTTQSGGAANQGVVYKLTTAGQETVLHSFTGGVDGANPFGGVILDSSGNIYGTTFSGGAASRTGLPEGVVFKLDPSGNESLLYSFTGLADGGAPAAGVILDSAGNLYGTTVYGGFGFGVVFSISAAGQESVLYSFTGEADGGNPYAGLIRDSSGNLYGTNVNFGFGGGGVVFRLSALGDLDVLYSFSAGAGGNSPFSGVVRDTAGNLYGTADYGGNSGCLFGCGVVYQITPSRQELILYSFTGQADGGNPVAGVTLDAGGNLYGTAGQDGAAGGGVVYHVSTNP